MNTPAIRINARLSGEDARRFQELQALEQRSSSDVLREAVREYHAKRIKRRENAFEIMRNHGLIGGGEGPADLSPNYKQHLAEILHRRYETTQVPSAKAGK